MMGYEGHHVLAPGEPSPARLRGFEPQTSGFSETSTPEVDRRACFAV